MDYEEYSIWLIQAEKIGEYLALARTLKEDDSKENYRRVSALSYELALWMPDYLYKAIGQAVAHPNDNCNISTVIIDIRRWLLETNSDELEPRHIIYHAPGIGKKNESPN